jgi:hypothetical protein
VKKPTEAIEGPFFPMPKTNTLTGRRDNHNRGTVADFLRAHIKEDSKLSVVSAFFTIYAYDALKGLLDRVEHMDFLFGEPRFVRSLDPDKTEKKSFIIDPGGLKLAHTLQQKRVAKECADKSMSVYPMTATQSGAASNPSAPSKSSASLKENLE